MTPLRVGDRIVLDSMPEDPCPIEPGTTGTVTATRFVNWPGRGFDQIDVDWDNGRTLSLCVPPDQVRVIA